MRTILIGTLALLAGCDPHANENSLDAQIARAELVYVCADGTKVGFDPVVRQLVYEQDGIFTYSRGRVARGRSPMQVCR